MSHVLASDVLSLHLNSKGELSEIQKSPETRSKTKPDKPLGTPLTTLFKSLAVLGPSLKAGNSNGGAFPTPAQCATHLELLEVFLQLRLHVLNSQDLDTIFGLKENRKTVFRKTRVGYNWRRPKFEYKQVTIKDTTWQARRREKWPYYLSIAAERFQVWMTKAEETLAGLEVVEKLSLPYQCLPPLDVLMVWHAFLLNPKDFAVYCDKQKLVHIRQAPFPWSQIHRAINMETLTYSLPQPAKEWLKSTAVLQPDLFAYLLSYDKACATEGITLREFGSSRPSYTATELEKVVNDSPASNDARCFLRAYTYVAKVYLLSHASRYGSDHKSMVSNVQRQASFVDKMHKHLWIRSPAVAGTLRRAISRYANFVQLFAMYPGKMLVPTLDIDLAWHTHQCDAAGYERTMREKTGRFIDHDDKLGDGVLKGGLDETKELFLARFGATYEMCLCWDCEALLECIEEEDEGENEDMDMEAIAERARQNVEYCRGLELARRKVHPIRPAR